MCTTRTGLLRILCLGLGLAAFPRPGVGQELTPAQIYRQTLRGMAMVAAPPREWKGGPTTVEFGSAWVVDRSRKLLITCYHVVGDRDRVIVVFPAFAQGKLIAEKDHYLKKIGDGPNHVGKVLDVDPTRDLALFQLEALPPDTADLKLATDSPGPGDRVHGIGNAAESGGAWGYFTGSVRQVYHSREKLMPSGIIRDARVLETQLPFNPGDSGGPVVDDAGGLVGVTSSFSLKAPSLTRCVHAAEVKAFLDEGAPTWVARTADEFNRRGVRRYKQGLWKRAADDFAAAVRLDDKKPAFYANRAWAHQQQRQHEQALADFSKALELDPKNARTYNDRGMVHLARGKPGDALTDFGEAIRLDPGFAVAYNNRGFAHFKRGEHDEALADFAEAIRLAPGDVLARHNRGLVHLEKHAYEEAVADFTEAIRLQPRFAAAYADRARAYAALNDPARARADRERAALLDPSLAKK
jgi:Tfp pilus assembly protein PilF